MREHKYRGKTSDGEWKVGDLTHNARGQSFINIGMCEGYDVIPETVGEYTGLPDMYKDEIFDGDILYEPSTDNYYTVIFDEGCFYALLDDDVLIQLSEINGSAETIGSIHDMEVQT